jgi:hypothetical protein
VEDVVMNKDNLQPRDDTALVLGVSGVKWFPQYSVSNFSMAHCSLDIFSNFYMFNNDPATNALCANLAKSAIFFVGFEKAAAYLFLFLKSESVSWRAGYREELAAKLIKLSIFLGVPIIIVVAVILDAGFVVERWIIGIVLHSFAISSKTL